MSILRGEVNKLLREIKRGNPESKGLLYETTYNHLKVIALSYVKNQQDMEDIISESFIRVFEYIETFRVEKDGYNWLCKIVQHCAYDWHKKNGKYIPMEKLPEQVPVGMRLIDMGEIIAYRDEIRRWMEPYDEIDRKIIKMQYWDDMNYREIAAALHMKLPTVYKRAQKIITEIQEKEKKRAQKVKKIEGK